MTGNFLTNEKIAILIQTGKDRLRYLDTTFNSIKNAIPSNVDIYITTYKAEQNILKYLTTNETISLDCQYLFPNQNTSWQKFIGEIPNKQFVTGIKGKYKDVIQVNIAHAKHYYEALCYSFNEIIARSNADYIVYIEDDVVFKKNFFETILNCINEIKQKNIGRVCIYKYGKFKNTGDRLIKNPGKQWLGPNVCLLLKTETLKKMNLDSYIFTSRDLPEFTQKRITENFIPQDGADYFLYNYIQKFTTSALYISESVCQHIGVMSSIYINVQASENCEVYTDKRCFFDHKKNLKRIDPCCYPPYVLDAQS